MISLENRFWAKVEMIPFHECWEWVGAKSPFGHGRIQFGTRGQGIIRAHRLSWELHNGPIPKGLLVCHSCDNPSCVRPEHLFLGTNRDNSRDMMNKGRGSGQFLSVDSRSNLGKFNKNKTKCKRGHTLSLDNIYVRKDNRRSCKLCNKERRFENK